MSLFQLTNEYKHFEAKHKRQLDWKTRHDMASMTMTYTYMMAVSIYFSFLYKENKF